MATYNHILVGLDLSPEESLVIATKAIAIAKNFNAKVSLTHVIEPLTFAYATDIPVALDEIQKSITDHANRNMAELITQLGAEQASHIDTSISLGQTAYELHAKAKEIDADLIVVGSHGRHGLSLIFGSTSTGVLHGAKCDVLAVRV